MRGRNKPIDQIKIAKERIVILFDQAEKAAESKKKGSADRYVEMARKIGMRYNVRIPSNLRRKFCRKCKRFLYKNLSADIKEEKGFLKITCINCGKKMQYRKE
ncbi:MAG: ribonuclease P [Candidatus Aenigmarchaeota archaeon]|nr:ribonuclease P [Candidatus Aenigmarchaeota archaeon]